jgi:serine/threonine protein kinase/formylglycine-generating enzyme required for sulfatase activity
VVVQVLVRTLGVVVLDALLDRTAEPVLAEEDHRSVPGAGSSDYPQPWNKRSAASGVSRAPERGYPLWVNSDSESTAELLELYLVAREKDTGLSFDHWVAAYPAEADALRRAWADCQRGTMALAGANSPSGLAPAAGQRVGAFTLVEHLGRGGQATVWEAEQEGLGRRVALKLLRSDRESRRDLALFQREARAGARLRHEGIVTVYDHGEEAGVSWIAQELIPDGRTLRDRIEEIRRQAVPFGGWYREVADVILSVALALDVAHDAGIVHRDVKPQNILLTPEGRPKVGDFGLARVDGITSHSQTGQLVGTYFYMSPEQVAAKRAGIDHRTDIFSLGTVLYEMLTLSRPFEGDTSHQICSRILMRDPPEPRVVRSQVPKELSVICGKALEKDPRKRYATMAEFAADIERHLSNEPIHAQPPTRFERIAKWTKRNPTKSVVTMVSALAFVVISSLAVLLSKQKEDLKTTNTELRSRTEQLATRTDDLTAANTALQTKTEEAQRRTSDVLRLSLAQDHEDLISAVDDLWPPHPEKIEGLATWVSDARALTGEIDNLVAKRDELRAMALPQSEEERQSHPDFAELERVEGELVFRRRALGQRRDGKEAELPDVDWSVEAGNAEGLVARAQPLVDGWRTSFGREALGVVLAERAIELASDGERSGIAATLSQAYFAVGRDDEALGMAFMAVDEAPEEERVSREAALAALENAVAEKNSEEGISAEAEVIEQLDQQLSDLKQRVRERHVWTFSEESEAKARARWWHNQLSGLIVDLKTLTAPGVGLLTQGGVSEEHGWSAPRRLAFARRLEAGFDSGGEYGVRWAEALPEINATYPGLSLAPQIGLVPMGADPESGLWEFWHVQTGMEPVRGENGKLSMEERSGLVFVLLPGGKFWMGAQPLDERGRNYDEEAEEREGPVHQVELSAFFLSKYEMTHGQWERTVGLNPSRWTAETLPTWIDGPHPVEQVSWLDCMAVMPMLGLSLPSEAQWEYGCRGGTDTPRPFPFADFAVCANIRDVSFATSFTGSLGTEPWNDTLGGPGPVGFLRPNAFGLYDTLGSVWEWVLDGFEEGSYAHSSLLDPVNSFAGTDMRVNRGASYDSTAFYPRSAYRYTGAPSSAGSTAGVRPARAVAD